MAVAGCNYFTITSSLTIKFNSARVDLYAKAFRHKIWAKIVVTSAVDYYYLSFPGSTACTTETRNLSSRNMRNSVDYEYEYVLSITR
jgi:hypothetical protein